MQWARLDPEPLRTEMDGQRWYVHPDTDRRMPAVSTVLEQTDGRRFALEAWERRLGPRNAAKIRDIAAARGTRLHRQADAFMGGAPAPVGDVWWESVSLLVRQLRATARVLLSEGAVFAPIAGFAGTPDGVILLEGRHWLIEWKTHAEEPGEAKLDRWEDQCAGYVEAIREQYDVEIDRALIVTAIPRQRAHVHTVSMGAATRRWSGRVDAFYG